MIRRAITLAGFVLFASCNPDQPPISEARMIPIVMDLHLADAYSTQVRDTLHVGFDRNYDSLSIWTLRVLAQNKVSQQEFNASMDWYRDHPDRLKALYEAAAERLEALPAEGKK